MNDKIQHMFDMVFDGPIEYESICQQHPEYYPHLTDEVFEDQCEEMDLSDFEICSKLDFRACLEDLIDRLLSSGNVTIIVKEDDDPQLLKVLELLGCLYPYALSVADPGTRGGYLNIEMDIEEGGFIFEEMFRASYTYLNVYQMGLHHLQLYNALAARDGKPIYQSADGVQIPLEEELLPLFPLSSYNLSIRGLDQLAYHSQKFAVPIDIENQAMLLYNMRYTGSLALTRAASLLSSLGLRSADDISDEFEVYKEDCAFQMFEVVKAVVASSSCPNEGHLAWSPIYKTIFCREQEEQEYGSRAEFFERLGNP